MERIIYRVYMMVSKRSLFPATFDARRAERGLEAFRRLGGRVERIKSKDKRADIQLIYFRAADFREKLEALGATWEAGQITPPLKRRDAWQQFEADMLSRFKWRKENGVIVTSSHANLSKGTKLFMHVNAASTVSCMLGERIGFWLGLGQDACVYDPRGTWNSSGIPSEGGYYSDGEAVLDTLLTLGKYNLKDVWVTSACGGSCVNAHLKKVYHDQGINCLFESAYVNLKEDYFDPQSATARKKAMAWYSGLRLRGGELPDSIEETGFQMQALWRGLKTKEGSVVIVHPDNDQHLAVPATPNKLEALAKTVSGNVTKIFFQSESNDPHRDRFYRHPNTTKSVLQVVFQTP